MIALIGGAAIGIAIVRDAQRIAAQEQKQVKGMFDHIPNAKTKPWNEFSTVVEPARVPKWWLSDPIAKPAPSPRSYTLESLPAPPSDFVIIVPVDPVTQAAADVVSAPGCRAITKGSQFC